MNKVLVVSLGFFLLALLGYVCIYPYSSHIQEDIYVRSVAALKENEFHHINIAIDGRDITLTGKVKNERRKVHAKEVLLSVFGVRAVKSLLVVSTSEKNKMGTKSGMKPSTKAMETTNPKLEPMP